MHKIWWTLFERADFRKSCCVCMKGDKACLLSLTNHLFGRLLGKKNGVDVGEDTTRSNSDVAEQLVQLLIILDSKSKVTGHDTSLLVVASSIAGELQDLGAEVLKDSGKVDGSAGTHAGGVLSLAEVTADTTNGELKSSLGRRGGALLLAAASFSFSRHG